MSNACDNCGETATLRCSRCRAARYCGAQCQRAHWPRHRGDCLRPLCDVGHKRGCCGWSQLRRQEVQRLMEASVGEDDGYRPSREAQAERDAVLHRHMRLMGIEPPCEPGQMTTALLGEADLHISLSILTVREFLLETEGLFARHPGPAHCPVWVWLKAIAPMVTTSKEYFDLFD